MKHIPNIISIFRLILVLTFVFLFINGKYVWSMAVYLIAFSSDVLDGYLARKHNWITNVGKVLDPLADKLMLLAVLCCFYSAGQIPIYVVIITFFKDFIMITIGILLYTRKVVVYADWFGKIATGLFMFAIVLTFIHLIWDAFDVHLYFYWLAMTAAIVSFFHYGIKTLVRKSGNGRIEE